MGNAGTHELVTLARSSHEALAVDDRDLLTAALNQPGMFQLCSGVGDRWSLGAEHFGKQVLADKKSVTIAAIAHH